jgi:hypothetical protein
MTEEQARTLVESRFWERQTPEELASFQLFEERLCMPFEVYQGAVEEVLGRPVFLSELTIPDDIRAEWLAYDHQRGRGVVVSP